jgi:hypothetical protein
MPTNLLQRFKEHPEIAKLLDGAELLSAGGRALYEGGLQGQYRLAVEGALFMGDTAGFLNVPKIKGIHFTNTWKHDQVSKLLEYIERDELRFCFDNVFEWRNSQNEFVRLDRPVLLEDMSHVVQSSTKTGKPRYDVERTEDGHGDAFFALLLVMDAHKSSNNILQVG